MKGTDFNDFNHSCCSAAGCYPRSGTSWPAGPRSTQQVVPRTSAAGMKRVAREVELHHACHNHVSINKLIATFQARDGTGFMTLMVGKPQALAG